jgi:hypothetical protein
MLTSQLLRHDSLFSVTFIVWRTYTELQELQERPPSLIKCLNFNVCFYIWAISVIRV